MAFLRSRPLTYQEEGHPTQYTALTSRLDSRCTLVGHTEVSSRYQCVNVIDHPTLSRGNAVGTGTRGDGTQNGTSGT